MPVILVTGMSGTGKSTVLKSLAQRGYRTIDTDYDDWISTDGDEPEWRVDRIDALLAEHERSRAPLFIAGTVWNQGQFYPRFAEVVLFSAPIAVLLERVTARDDNPFGKSAEERSRIAVDTAEVEPLLRKSATLEIDTCRPLAEVVDQLAALVVLAR